MQMQIVFNVFKFDSDFCDGTYVQVNLIKLLFILKSHENSAHKFIQVLQKVGLKMDLLIIQNLGRSNDRIADINR